MGVGDYGTSKGSASVPNERHSLLDSVLAVIILCTLFFYAALTPVPASFTVWH
jgi:hypothetical protein